LVAVMLGVLRKRPEAQAATADAVTRLVPAPRSLRLIAGIVDALPVLAANAYIAYQIRTSDDPLTSAFNFPWLMIVSAFVYLLHTTIVELSAGRSIGKMLFGLDVVALDGKKPKASKMLIRNVIRLLEFELFFPLLMIYFTPLAQRLGDMAAGTVVIARKNKSDAFPHST